MARWTDIAQWSGPAADNFGDGDWVGGESADAMWGYRGLVLHIAEGSYAGTIAWENNPGSDISSHFVVAKDGRCTQMVDTHDRAWTQAAGNGEWLSVECEGRSGDALTEPQIMVLARIMARAHQVHGIPLQLADSAGGRGLGWHGMGGALWGGHYQCPGPRIVAQRQEIIDRARSLGGSGGGNDMGTLDGRDPYDPNMPQAAELRNTYFMLAQGYRPGEANESGVIARLQRIEDAIGRGPVISLTDAQVDKIADRVAAAVAERPDNALTDGDKPLIVAAVQEALREGTR